MSQISIWLKFSRNSRTKTGGMWWHRPSRSTKASSGMLDRKRMRISKSFGMNLVAISSTNRRRLPKLPPLKRSTDPRSWRCPSSSKKIIISKFF